MKALLQNRIDIVFSPPLALRTHPVFCFCTDQFVNDLTVVS